MDAQQGFSVLILTMNEEANIASCLGALRGCDDIVVLDSFSTDATLDIVARFGARVHQRSFDGFAGQRNFALDEIAFKYPWLLHLDADEIVTPEFLQECRELAAHDEKSAYLVPSQLIFQGRWLKHAAGYPVYQMRFMKLGEVRFVQDGHGQRESEPLRGIGYMRHPYRHYNFSKGLREWIDKHNIYSSAEAEKNVCEKLPALRDLFNRDVVLRRRALKKAVRLLPLRPFLRFFHLYILNCGFLDMQQGYIYCRLMAIYEYFIVLKEKELKRASPAREFR